MVSTIAPILGGLARCSVGSMVVGLDLIRVIGVERADRIRPLDKPGPKVLGAITNRAGQWPVYHLADFLGISHTANRRTGQVVLLSSGGKQFGLLVDRVTPVARGEQYTMAEVPPAVGSRSLFIGTAILAQGPLLLLDPDRLLTPPPLAEPVPRMAPAQRPSENRRSTDRLFVFGHQEIQGRTVGIGLPAGCVAEVFDAGAGTPAAGAKPHLTEVIAWRGQPLAVLDIA
ncbi:MAG: chemotaxis protein CheW, partial [Gemmataceae bacterium]